MSEESNETKKLALAKLSSFGYVRICPLTGLHHLALVFHNFRQVCHHAGSLVCGLDVGAVHHVNQNRQAPFQHDVHFAATTFDEARRRAKALQ